MTVYKVAVNGCIRYKGKRYRMGEDFSELIELVSEDNNLASISYCHQKILTLDLNNFTQ